MKFIRLVIHIFQEYLQILYWTLLTNVKIKYGDQGLTQSNNDGSDLIEWGLSDGWKQNKWYKSILDKLNI